MALYAYYHPGVLKALPFALALRQTRGLGQCLHHRREEATGSLHTALALDGELCGSVSTLSPAQPLPPSSLPHLGGRRHLTARFSMGLFLRVPGISPGGKPRSAFGTGGPGDAVFLGPEAQDRRAFCPDSFLRVVHEPLP